MKKLTILIAVLLFMIVPFPDSNANTYSESPYNCSFDANIGVGASISLFGFNFNADGNISLTWGNAGYSCSSEGVGCTSGLTCVEFWQTHASVIPPSMGG